MEENQSTFPPTNQVLFVLFLTFFLFSILIMTWNEQWGKWGLLFVEASTIVPAVIYLRVKQFSLKQVFRLQPVSLSVLAVSAMIGVGLSLVTEEIDRLVQYIFPMPELLWQTLAETMVYQSTTELIVLILAVVVTASLVEEMLFRGFLQGALEQSMDVTRAVLIAAFIFAAIHFNPWWVIEILILGVLIGVMALKSQSIFPGVVVHGVNNGLALLLINSQESSYQFLFYKGHVSPIWFLVGLAFVFGGFWLFYQLFDRKSIDLIV